MKWSLLVIFLVILVLFILPQPQEKKSETIAASNDFMIKNVRLYDGNTLMENIDVLVEQQRISQIAPSITLKSSLTIIDGTGRTLIPGLVDSHTHAWGEALTQALNFGVTTELDMFTMPQFSQPKSTDREQLNNVLAADLFSSTILATAPKGHGTEYGISIPVLEAVEQVDNFVQERISQGADYIKAVYQSKNSKAVFNYPSISLDILKELVEVAHANNKLLVVHIDDQTSAKEAIEAGADGIIHSFMDSIVEHQLLTLMQRTKAFIIPTLTVEASLAKANEFETNAGLDNDYLSSEQRSQLHAQFPPLGIESTQFANALQSIALFSQAGITIMAGTDAPNPGTTHGYSLHRELEWLVKAGLSNQQALHAATGAAGKIFPLGQRGTLAIGAPASMILIDGDPITNISDTQKIHTIWKNGVVFNRKTYSSEAEINIQVTAAKITDFNHSISSTTVGAGIAANTDQFAGGNSSIQLSRQNYPEQPDNYYLQATGELSAGSMYPWSGVGFLPGKSFQQGANLSKIKHFSFTAKTNLNASTLSVLIYQQGSFQPYRAQFTLQADWKTYKLKFADINNIDLSKVASITLAITGAPQTFEFCIDDLFFE